MLLCLVMLLSSVSARALNYPEHSGNPATFETLEEAHANGPAAIQDLEENATKTPVPHPALDRSRVYVTGYSMGGFATLNAIFGDSSIFAAAAPQAGAGIPPTEENELQYKDIDLPIMIFHSEYALFFYIDPATGNITDRVKGDLNRFLRYNEMDELEFDFEAYPINGFEGDRYEEKLLNGEHLNRCWTMLNDEGVPMVAFNYTCDLQHALYPEYAKLIWDYCKQFSRDLETGAVIYNPYAE